MDMLSRELTTLAFCWRVERRDGVAIGLTGHDRDLVLDGLVHRAAPGMVPSAIRRGLGLDGDAVEIAGALTSAAIGEADLLAGRWDGARVVLFAVDWADPGAGRVALGEGRLGAVSVADGRFTAELQGAGAALARAVVEETSPECRAELGDRRCRVPMAGRRVWARVTGVAGSIVTVDRSAADGVYAGGRLRWFGPSTGSGRTGLGGLESMIEASEGATVTLTTMPAGAATGALVELIEGCDKSLATCAGRFANAVNFRGEPYLPGIDLLTRYPGA